MRGRAVGESKSEAEVIRCQGCETPLTARDRYCAVCGHPNHASERIPRFGPGTHDVDPFVEIPEAGPNEIPCPRCRRPARKIATYCSWCGMDLDDATLADRRGELIGVWDTYGPNGAVPYRPLRTWAAPLRAILALCAGLGFGALVLVALRFADVEDGEVVDSARPWLADVGDLVMWLLVGFGLLVTLGLVAFVVRASRNLRALAVEDARFSPATAAWCWFVPVVNLVLPYAVTEDVWRASGPDGFPITRLRRTERAPLSVHLWWPCLALGALLLAVSFLAMPESTGGDADGWRMVLVLGGIGALTLSIGFLAAALVVGDIAFRQSLRAEAIGPPSWLRRGDETVVDDADPEPVGAGVVRTAEDGPWGKY